MHDLLRWEGKKLLFIYRHGQLRSVTSVTVARSLDQIVKLALWEERCLTLLQETSLICKVRTKF
jgi:hypothetical protein